MVLVDVMGRVSDRGQCLCMSFSHYACGLDMRLQRLEWWSSRPVKAFGAFMCVRFGSFLNREKKGEYSLDLGEVERPLSHDLSSFHFREVPYHLAELDY